VLREVLLSASSSGTLRQVVEKAPVSRHVVARYVAGPTTADAVRATADLVDQDLMVTIDHLGEDTVDHAQADQVTTAYLELLEALARDGLTRAAEVSVKLSAVGQALPGDGEQIALDNARRICASATSHGTSVTLDMEDHTTTDSTLGILRELRTDFPDTGAVLQSYLHRTEDDCRDLAYAGSRVRLCKGAYAESSEVAFTEIHRIRRNFVELMEWLMVEGVYPAIATHDESLITAARDFADRQGIGPDRFEFQLLYGVRRDLQTQLIEDGYTVRVYVPFGDQWYPYLMRRLAERPENLAFMVESLVKESSLGFLWPRR
jgi:proline dehydrogenase